MRRRQAGRNETERNGTERNGTRSFCIEPTETKENKQIDCSCHFFSLLPRELPNGQMIKMSLLRTYGAHIQRISCLILNFCFPIYKNGVIFLFLCSWWDFACTSHLIFESCFLFLLGVVMTDCADEND